MSSTDQRRSPGWRSLLGTEFGLVVAIIAVVLAASILDSNHSYLRPADARDIIQNILRNTAMLGIFALGAAVVIIAGGIDLSSGSTIAFCGSISATLMLVLAPKAIATQAAIPTWMVLCGMAAAVLAGLLVGTLHAWLITAVRLPPFVATLATLVGLRSFARAFVEYMTRTVGGSKNPKIYVRGPVFEYLRDNVWVSVAVFGVLAIITWVLLTRTVLGRHLFALGGNEQAARLSGIRTERVKWFAYCFAGLTAGIASIFYVANEAAANPVDQGRGQELNAIAAAVVGGCSLQGGIGTVPGVVLGALFLQVVIDAVAKVIKTGADVYEGLIVGAVVVLAVTFSQWRQLAGTGKGLFPGALGWCVIPILAGLSGAIGVMTLGVKTGVGLGATVAALLVLAKSVEARGQRVA